jgi:CTP synthase
VGNIYEVPLVFHREGLDNQIIEKLKIWTRAPQLDAWEALIQRINGLSAEVTIAVVGKYVKLIESYKSLNEALFHGGLPHNCKVHLKFIDSEEILDQKTCQKLLASVDGVLVPGGFGSRGIEGKIRAVRFAREERVPFFGICLGMHVATIEFARNVVGLAGANSAEFDKKTPHPVIYLMLEWYDEQTQTVQKRNAESEKGASMRLGAYTCALKKETFAARAYEASEISERHRHRFEFNNEYRQSLEDAGLIISGTSPNGELVEITEIADHPWFLGCQFHPEFKSRPMDPHPLFRDFIGAALNFSKKK